MCASSLAPGDSQARHGDGVAQQAREEQHGSRARETATAGASRKKRNVRQPSRKVRRCGACIVRPSGCSVIGTSAIAALNSAALITISVANSMPVHRRSSRS